MFAAHRLSGLVNFWSFCFSTKLVFRLNLRQNTDWMATRLFCVFIPHMPVSINKDNLLRDLTDYLRFICSGIHTQPEKEAKNTTTLICPRGTQKSVTTRVIWSSSRPPLCLCWRFGLCAYLHLSPPQETKSMNKNCCSCLNRVWRSFQKHTGSCHIKSPQSLSDEESSRL